MHRRWLRRIVLYTCAVGVPAACNGILGTPEPLLQQAPPPDGSPSLPSDGASASDAAAPDDAPSEVAVDAAMCCGDASCGLDLSRDALNCGTCGHDCLGGSCDAGRCAPVVVAGSVSADGGLFQLNGIAVIGDTLYATDYQSPKAAVVAVARTGVGATPVRFFPPVDDAGSRGPPTPATVMASTGTRLYFAVPLNLGIWPAGVYPVDTTNPSNFTAPYPAAPLALSVNASYVYTTDKSGYVFVLDAVTLSFVAQLSVLPRHSSPIAGDPERLFFLHLGVVDVAMAPAFTFPTEFYSASAVDAFAIDGTFLYVIDGAAGRAYRRGYLSQDVVHEITPAQSFTLPYPPVQMLVDAANVYVAISSDSPARSSLLRFPKAGGAASATTVAVVDDALGAMTDDDIAVYFTTKGLGGPPFGAIWRVAK